MARILIQRRGNPGRKKLVTPKHARLLTRLGKWELAHDEEVILPKSAPPEDTGPRDEYSDLSYHDLRSLVAERELEAESQRKDDLLKALRAGRGSYDTRALNADTDGE